MKIGVISDIHGNAFALEHVMADLKSEAVDQLVCLGDAIQGGPQPAETVAMLRDLGCPVVMGNSDEWLLTGEWTARDTPSPNVMDRLNAVRGWSLEHLSNADRAFIHAFKPTIEVALDGKRNLLCFHGSPTSFEDILAQATPEDEFLTMLTPYLPHLMAGGHTHAPQVRYIGTSDSFFFNPGSVGVAHPREVIPDHRRASPWAEYAVLTAGNGRLALEFRRVAYDPQALINIYRSS